MFDAARSCGMVDFCKIAAAQGCRLGVHVLWHASAVTEREEAV